MTPTRPPGFEHKTPFFIIGSGRCGSTYLYGLLEPHPRIAITNESGVFQFLHFCSLYANLEAGKLRPFSLKVTQDLHGVVAKKYKKEFSAVFDSHVVAMIEEFYASQFQGREFSLWGDKLTDPSAALAFQELVPDTRLLLLIRDPRDVVCSWLAFSRRGWVRQKFSFLEEVSIGEWARGWNSIYANMRAYGRNLHEIKYEDLVANPLDALRAIMTHLGDVVEAPQVEEIAKHELFSGHGTSKSPEASIQRWRRELRASQVREIESLCGELMQELGYELSR